MKKLSILGIILSLLLVCSVFGVGELVIQGMTNPTGNPGASVTGTFTVVNAYTTAINDITFSVPAALTGPGTNTIPTSQITFSPSIINLPVASSQIITYTVNIPSQQYVGAYTGIINASNGTYSATSGFTVTVNQVVSTDLGSEIDSGVLLVSGSEDETITNTFTLINSGNVDITNMQIKIDELTDGSLSDGDHTLSFRVKVGSGSFQTAALGSNVNLGTIGIGNNVITIETTIPNNMEVNNYEANISLQSSTPSAVSESFALNVMIEPEICEDGRMSNGAVVTGGANSGWVRVSIDEPDDGNDFKQGNEIDVEVNVQNEGSDDMDIIVETILYDLDADEEITSIESESTEITDGEDEDFTLTLTIPYTDELEEDNTYYLYVKAYEEDDEDQNCNYDSIELDFKRESNEVIIDSFTITPTVVNPGQTVSFNINTLNIGEDSDDEVYVKVYNSELGLDEESVKFELGEYDKSDNSETKTISFVVPTTAEAKEYIIEALVYYDNGGESYSVMGTLTVSGEAVSTTTGTGILTLPQTSISATIGKVFSIPFTINNQGTSALTYTVEVSAVGDWAEDVTETITVQPGSSNTGYAYLTSNSNTASGSYTATVTLKQDSSILGTSNVNINLAKDSTGATGAVTYQPAGTILSSLTGNTWFWIIGNIVLVFLVILILFLIFRKR